MYTIKRNSQLMGFVLLSLVLTYGIFVNKGFPYLGFAVAWCSITTTIYLQKQCRDTFVHWVYFLSMALSISVFWRANGLLTFFNLIGAVGLTSVLAIVHDGLILPGILQTVFSPLVLFSRALSTGIAYAIPARAKSTSTALFQRLKLQESISSILVTVIALAIIIPLLAFSNPFFKNIVDETFALLNIARLLERLLAWNISFSNWTLFQLVVFGFLLIFIPRLYAFIATQKKEAASAELFERRMLLPKLAVSAVLVLFFATQVQLYFASDAQLLAVGSTPSQRTNEVFGQLSIVTAIILGLLYFFRSYSKIDRKVTVVLLVETIFLTGIAFSSVFQYASNFGFTFKRLWGIAIVFWLLSLVILYARVYLKRAAAEYSLQSLLVLTAVGLVLVNVANFDYLIAHLHQPRTGEGIDYRYIMQNVSYDARAFEVLATGFDQQVSQSNDLSAGTYALYNRNEVNRQIESLQRKYSRFDFRTLNLGEHAAYRTIKQYDVQADMQRVNALDAEMQAKFRISPSPTPNQ